MTDALFKVGADTSDYVSKMAHAEKATKKVAKEAAGIGTAVTGSILKVAMLQQALTRASAMLTQMIDKAKSVSETSGERAKALSTSFLGMGFRDVQGAQNRFMGSSGLMSSAERVPFARSVADANRKRQVPLGEDDLAQVLAAGARGGQYLYGEGASELTEGIGKGLSLEEITKESASRRPGTFAALSDSKSLLSLELSAQSAEGRAEGVEARQLASQGAALRHGAAEAKIRGARKQADKDASAFILDLGISAAIISGQDSVTSGAEFNAEQNAMMLREASGGPSPTSQAEISAQREQASSEHAAWMKQQAHEASMRDAAKKTMADPFAPIPEDKAGWRRAQQQLVDEMRANTRTLRVLHLAPNLGTTAGSGN